jgi:hypothetical protein
VASHLLSPDVPPKHRFIYRLHGAISQKMVIFKFSYTSIASHDFGGSDSLYAAIQSKISYLKILKFQTEKSTLKLIYFSIQSKKYGAYVYL